MAAQEELTIKIMQQDYTARRIIYLLERERLRRNRPALYPYLGCPVVGGGAKCFSLRG
jgi:hypothetical protein